MIEAILTMVLIVAVFGTAIDPRAPKIGGLAIGLAVAADIFMGGPLTGAAMNPARWFGPAVVSGTYTDWYVWWIGPLVGRRDHRARLSLRLGGARRARGDAGHAGGLTATART